MEDVLEVYKQSYDAKHPLICMDESSKQQVKEVREPLPVEAGKTACYDTEYERNGVSNLFIFTSTSSAQALSLWQANAK